MERLKDKTIVLTGAKGFIGSQLAKKLAGYCYLIPLAKGEIYTSGRVDILIHLGAFTPKSNATANSINDIYISNIEATYKLLNTLPNVPENIIFSSTLDVYAPTNNELITEKSAVGPTTLYGASKLFCEHLIDNYAKQNDSNCIILRYGNVYGPGEDKYTKLIPQTIKALLEGNDAVIYGDPNLLRDFIYIDDVIEATARCILNKKIASPINVVNGNSKSIKEYVEIISKMIGSDSIKYIPTNIIGHSRLFNNQNMFNMLGKWNLTSFENGILQEINYFKKEYYV